jgi:hypothetical protein
MSPQKRLKFFSKILSKRYSVRAQAFYEFGRFRLTATEGLLTRDGEVVPLTRKVFDPLTVLVENNRHMVDKDELLRALWPDTFVEEGNLTQNVSTQEKPCGKARTPNHDQKLSVETRFSSEKGLVPVIHSIFSSLLEGLRGEEEGRIVLKFEVHSLRPARRVGPDGDSLNQLIISLIQSRDLPLNPDAEDKTTMIFRGGCTLILDLDTMQLR